MSSIIRIKENPTLQEMFDLLQSTLYSGLDKTEIIRSLIAEKVWSIKGEISQRPSLDLTTAQKQKVTKAIQSYQDGKYKIVAKEKVQDHLTNLADG